MAYKAIDRLTDREIGSIEKMLTLDNGFMACVVIYADNADILQIPMRDIDFVEFNDKAKHVHDNACEWHFGRCYSE